MRASLLAGLATTALVTVGGCVAVNKPVHADEFVTVTYEGHTNVIAVHSSGGRMMLRFGDQTYEAVRGGKPYYLRIPDTDYILFATGGEGRGFAHLAHTRTHHVRSFAIHDSQFGRQIGNGEKVEEVRGNELTTTAPYHGGTQRASFDLGKPQLLNEVLDYVAADRVFHIELPHGRRPAP